MILSEFEAKGLLEKAGIAVVAAMSVRSLTDACREAETIGYPVAMKFSSAIHTHKSEIGGVILDIKDSLQLELAFSRMQELKERLDPEGLIVIQPMASPGAEVFIGYQRHESFGPVLSVGLGGVFLELMRDVTFRLLPAPMVDFEEMLHELKCWPKLAQGFRQLPPVGQKPLLELIARVAAFAVEREQVLEMDLNPVFAYGDRALVADARIALSEG